MSCFLAVYGYCCIAIVELCGDKFEFQLSLVLLRRLVEPSWTTDIFAPTFISPYLRERIAKEWPRDRGCH